VSTSNLDLVSPETKGRVASVYDAETTNQLKDSLENPETAVTFARTAVGLLNTPMGVVDESDPDASAKQEELQQQKAKGRADLDMLLALQQEGRGKIAVAKDVGGVEAAADRGLPVVVEMPDGKFEFKQFKNDDEVDVFSERFLTLKQTKAKEDQETKKKAEEGGAPWLPTGIRKFAGFQSVEETDKKIADLKSLLENLGKDPVKEPDTVKVLETKRQIAEEEAYKKKQGKRESARANIKEFNEVSDRVLKLSELASDPMLPAADQKEARARADKLQKRIEELSKLEEVRSMLRGRAAAELAY
jgi:hypothetical protein